ncbi:MAG: helix-turn-helix transcriptional regulator [Acidobacteria bacterium]|jgi:DNA-binding PadR family transcriptional regulator|nr:helix-turn-helix transcriptional regulator [Acidobacteriota bacterium]
MPPTRQSFATGPLPPAAFLMLVSLADRPSHGYQLRKDLIERSGGAIELDAGSLYRLIFKLGEDGLVEATSSPADDAGPRRVYQLTAVGRGVLKSETARLTALVEQANAVTTRRRRHA